MLARILVVEDDRFIREIVATTLSAEGYAVDVTEDGAKAWDYLAQHKPELVVLDLALPYMDGITLCRKLRATPGGATVPVLVVSASSGRAVIQAALEAGADDFLDKPFDLADLAGRVQRLIGVPKPIARAAAEA